MHEPANLILCIVQTPTITSERDAGFVPEKYSFTEKFDVLPFIGVKKKLLFDHRGKIRNNSSADEPLTKATLRGGKGCVDAEFKYNKNKLSYDSKPWEIMDAFIPFKKHDKKSQNKKKMFNY